MEMLHSGAFLCTFWAEFKFVTVNWGTSETYEIQLWST